MGRGADCRVATERERERREMAVEGQEEESKRRDGEQGK